ncbi:hypothetical protein M2318_000118 [Metapseudomonas resinovorans]|uniref:hypothetical protein n=1 Tax=Metapseudomonas resinovorans TaxID=53412 RepID=UPI003D1FA4F8
MKVENSLTSIAVADAQPRRQPLLPEAAPVARRKADKQPDGNAVARGANKNASFNLQLNQQLSSMQTAESYLDQLAEHLGQLKLNIGRELSNPQSGDKPAVREAAQQVNTLLEERSKRSGNALDASLKLRLHEPVRSRFSLQGLESVEAIQRSGKETLLFSGGRALGEPVAVVLDDGMSTEQVLRRFNASLGQAGIRAELDRDGALKFSAQEGDWQALKGQLRVQGEDKLFAKGRFTALGSQEEGLKAFPTDFKGDTLRELRLVLDQVVSALDKVSSLREQIRNRQQDIREFLARQSSEDERTWAHGYATAIFNLMRKSPTSYGAVTQTVVAQANLSRYAVVSLLS